MLKTGRKGEFGHYKGGRETLQRWARNPVYLAICIAKGKTREKYMQLCPSILQLFAAKKKKKRYYVGVNCRQLDKDFVFRNEIVRLVQ